MKSLRYASAALTSLLLAGCATQAPRTAPNRAPAVTAPAMPVVAQPTLAPDAYFAQIASLHLYVVTASDQVAAREGDTALGQAARQLAEHHRGIAAQLNLAGRRLNLLPSAALLPRHGLLLAELDGSAQPSALYARQMKSLLIRAYAIHERFATRGNSPTLRPLAAMAAPIIAQDYQLIKGY